MLKSLDEWNGAHFGQDADRIFQAQVDALYRTALPGVLGALVAAYVIIAALVSLGDIELLRGLVWAALISGCVAFHYYIHQSYQHEPSRYDTTVWANLFTIAALADGLWWGAATFALPNEDRLDEQMIVLAVALVVATGAVPAFSSRWPALVAIYLPISIMAAISQLAQKGLLHQAVAVLICVAFVTVVGLGLRAYTTLAEMFQLRFKTERLVEDIRRQKERAEKANTAKSHFLASASHDLRQPVHALGMFAGALARFPMSEEMHHLVCNIEASVESMEVLFGSMLDISRLDAGVIEVKPHVFALGPLLARIVTEHTPEAQAKGVTLKLCPTSAFVVSDEALLERIVRNIVSNAVRYTNQGRILVGCRRGTCVRIEVWDTGHGIATADRERIFDEFYQVGNPHRDRSQGLGLGLSIVRRLTALLDHKLELESELGKGSVFKVCVPKGRPVENHAVGPELVAMRPPDFGGAVIAVIDDDQAVLEGISTLLSSWRAQVVKAASGNELIAKLDSQPLIPHILLCDFRLPSEDGIEVIQRVRAHIGIDIACIIVTGDTASEQVRRAQASGIQVLYKPVPNGKLRALIGNLLPHLKRAQVGRTPRQSGCPAAARQGLL